MFPEPGTYNAKAHEGTVYETDGGALMAAFNFRIDEERSIVGYFCLASKSGEIQQKTVQSLREAFGWDGVDPFWLADNDLSGIDVEIVVEMEQGQDGQYRPRVRWVNKPGGGHGMPQSGDRRAILAKYGARFRALSGGAPVKPQPTQRQPAPQSQPDPGAVIPPQSRPPVAPPAPRSAPKTPPPAGPTATLQEAWDAICHAEAASMLGEDAITNAWYEIVNTITGGKEQGDCTPQDWGRVKAEGPAMLEQVLDRV